MSEPGRLSIRLADFSDEDDVRERIAWTANRVRWLSEAACLGYRAEVDWAHDHVWLHVNGLDETHIAFATLTALLSEEGRGFHRKRPITRLSFGVTWTPPIKKGRKK